MQIGLGSTEMGLGAGVWDLSLWDAPGSTWNGDEPLWRDFSCDGIDAHIEAGRGRITDPFPVARAQVRVDNSTGWADPTTEFEIDSAPGYIEFDGGLGELTVPDAAAIDFSGDFTAVMRIWVTTAPVGAQYPIRKGVDPDLAYEFGIFENTDVFVNVSPDGTVASADNYQTTGQPQAVGMWRWFAFAHDANDGAGGRRGSWWYGGDGSNPFAWQIIETIIHPTGAITIHNSTDVLRIGQFDGRFGHISLRNGHGGLSGAGDVNVGGTEVFVIDGWYLSAADVGAATFTALTGQTVTVVPDGASVPTIVPAVNPAGSSLLEMRPGRPIRIGVEHDSFGQCWRFNGFIDEILPSDAPDDWSTVTLSCIDALGEAGRAKLTAEVESGAGELAQTRFARILNAITWPTTKRAISTSAIRPLYATELAGQVVDLLRRTAESDGGWTFGDNNGNVVLQNRDWLYHQVGEEPDGIIGNFGGGFSELLLESGDDLLLEQSDEFLLEASDVEVCPSGWQRSFARQDISTQVTLDRDLPADTDPEPPPVVFNDLPAQVLYGIEPYERLDLWTLNTPDLQQIAGRILSTRAAALSMPRIRSVTIDAATSVEAVDLLSSLSIFTPSRYRCRLRTDRGTVFDANFFACGVVEDISADAWTAEISLDRTRPFEILDPGDYIWDTARWDRSLWN